MRTIGLCIVFLTVLCCSVKPALAQEDKTPPVVHSISVAPALVDAALGGQTINVTLQATDDLSGVRDVIVFFKPDADPSKTFSVTASTPLGGDMFMGTAELPQDSLRGIWRANLILVFDNAGNAEDYFKTLSRLPWPPGNDIFKNDTLPIVLVLPLIKNSVIYGLPPPCIAPGVPLRCLP